MPLIMFDADILLPPEPPPPPERFAAPPFVDRSAMVNVLRELDGIEIVRIWSNKSTRVYFGVGPTGLAGFNFGMVPRRVGRPLPAGDD